jgi:hypothetical protein
MSIVVPNATYTTIRRPRRIVIPNATINNVPKAGKNGTGSQFPDRPKQVPTKPGNAFGRNGYQDRTPVQDGVSRPFGDRSNAGVATSPTNRTETAGQHPNAHFFNTGTLPKRVAKVSGGASEGFEPVLPAKAILIQPHMRTGIGANRSRNLTRRGDYRTVSGAAPTSPNRNSNNPFHPEPKRVQAKIMPRPVVEAGKIPRAVQPSFNSTANLWSDPNNSFYEGAVQAATGAMGKGRWSTIKRGAAG